MTICLNWEQIYKTRKQQNDFIFTNRKGAKFCCSLPIGQIKWFIKENNIILGEIVVLLYSKSLPG